MESERIMKIMDCSSEYHEYSHIIGDDVELVMKFQGTPYACVITEDQIPFIVLWRDIEPIHAAFMLQGEAVATLFSDIGSETNQTKTLGDGMDVGALYEAIAGLQNAEIINSDFGDQD